MSYESAVPVACTLLLGKVIGVTAPDHPVGEPWRAYCCEGISTLRRNYLGATWKPKAAARCGGMPVVDQHGDASEDRHSGPTVAADVQKRT